MLQAANPRTGQLTSCEPALPHLELSPEKKLVKNTDKPNDGSPGQALTVQTILTKTHFLSEQLLGGNLADGAEEF